MKVLFLALAIALAAGGGAGPSAPRPAVLVELFTSEGCSSCPPADRLLARFLEAQPAGGVEVVPLELHVHYWDRLGWKDPFSNAAFTRRQEAYSRIFGEDRIYTPQMVVDGRAEVVGSDESAALGAIRKAASEPHLPLAVSAFIRGGALSIAVQAPALPARTETIDVVAAVVEDGLSSMVRAGENGGRTLPHSAVARRVESIGQLGAAPSSAQVLWKMDGAWRPGKLRVVTFLQGRKTLRIYGASAAQPTDFRN